MEERKVREIVLDLLEEICGDDIEIEEKIGVIMAPSELRRDEMDTPNKIVYQIMKRIQ